MWENFSQQLNNLPYFIEYNVHTSIVSMWIAQVFLAKKFIFIFQEQFYKNQSLQVYSS
jgi:hypothetical protein